MLSAYFSTISLDYQTVLVAISVVMNTVLGVFIFSRKRDEFANRVYVFNIACIIWWSVMIIIYRIAFENLQWWAIGLYVAPTFIASTFVYFSLLFPEVHPQIPLKRYYLPLIAALNVAIVAITLVPGLIIGPVVYVPDGENIIFFGPFYLAYATYISGLFGLGLFILARKWTLLVEPTKKRQIMYLLLGYFCASTLAMVANLTLPYFGYFTLNWLGQVFTVFMVLPVTYAIFKHRLFDVKVIATELITISLWIFLLARLLLDANVRDRVIDGVLFLVMLVIGVLLIRSVDREVRQREILEKQEKALEDINRQQESLLHFISHEVKGYLTKSEAAFAAIFAGDYGEVQPKLHDMSGLALADVRKGVDTVIDILDASNLRRGTVSFKKDTFDLVAAIDEIVRDLQIEAQARGLELTFERPVTGAYMYVGDEEKIRRHVIRNLVDNSVKYTLKGFVRIQLARTPNLMRITISDSGVGITPEDMKHLFTEGGKGAESIKVNVHSTGYGLFIAKTIVEGHGGKIWAESEGKDKGSRFIVELPIQGA